METIDKSTDVVLKYYIFNKIYSPNLVKAKSGWRLGWLSGIEVDILNKDFFNFRYNWSFSTNEIIESLNNCYLQDYLF